MIPSMSFQGVSAILRVRGNWYRAFWLISVVALIGVGARSVRSSVSAGRKSFLGPDSALEMHAEYAAEKPGALAPLRAALSELPAEKPLLVFVHPGDVRGGLAEQLVLYLSWPRGVELSDKVPGSSGESIARLREKYGGLVLCGWHAPEGVPGVDRVGPGIEVVRLAASQP
jgi:hypothetical protein